MRCDGYQLIVNGTISPASTVNSPTVVNSGVPRSATGEMNWIAFGPATALGPKTKLEDMKPYYEHLAELDPQMILKAAQAMHAHSAEDLLRKDRLTLKVANAEKGSIVRQTPAPGTEVAPGTVIEVFCAPVPKGRK